MYALNGCSYLFKMCLYFYENPPSLVKFICMRWLNSYLFPHVFIIFYFCNSCITGSSVSYTQTHTYTKPTHTHAYTQPNTTIQIQKIHTHREKNRPTHTEKLHTRKHKHTHTQKNTKTPIHKSAHTHARIHNTHKNTNRYTNTNQLTQFRTDLYESVSYKAAIYLC